MVIRVTAPNGDKVDFPDGTPDDVMAKAMQETYGGPQPSVAGDVAKSFGTGIVKGGIGLGGFVGDVGRLGDSLTNKLGINGAIDNSVDSLAGKDSMIGGYAKSLAHALVNPGSMLPSSSDIQSTLEHFTGPLYTPKTTSGEWAQTGGEFLPNLLGGEGVGALRLGEAGVKKGLQLLGKDLVTDVALPAAGSEAAGQLSSDMNPAVEPYARLAGALLGGGLGKAGASILEARSAPKVPSMQAVTDKAVDASNMADTIKSAAQDAYKAADDAGVVIGPTGMKTTFDGLKAKVLADTGLPKINTVFADNFPNIKAKLSALDDVAKGPSSLMGLDKLRQTLRSLPSTASDAEQRYANMMVKGLDDYVANLTPADVVSGKGPTQEAVDALTGARKLYRESALLSDKTKLVGDLVDKAKDAVGANYTQAGMNTAIRQQFRSLKDKIRKNDDVASLFSNDEKGLINNLVNGTDAENSMRYWSKFIPDKALNSAMFGGSGAGMASAALGGGPLGTGLAGALAAGAAGWKGVQGLAARGAENRQRGTLDDLMNAMMNDGKAVPKPPRTTATAKQKLADTLIAGSVLGTTNARIGN